MAITLNQLKVYKTKNIRKQAQENPPGEREIKPGGQTLNGFLGVEQSVYQQTDCSNLKQLEQKHQPKPECHHN
jgi:hypothetical protein